MNPEQAEIVAIQALGWLAADEERLAAFLGLTGANNESLKESASDPVFLGSVLDYILIDDTHVTGFCDTVNLPYETPMTARQLLPGGRDTNWT